MKFEIKAFFLDSLFISGIKIGKIRNVTFVTSSLRYSIVLHCFSLEFHSFRRARTSKFIWLVGTRWWPHARFVVQILLLCLPWCSIQLCVLFYPNQTRMWNVISSFCVIQSICSIFCLMALIFRHKPFVPTSYPGSLLLPPASRWQRPWCPEVTWFTVTKYFVGG